MESEFSEKTVLVENMDELIRLFGVFDENLKIIESETQAHITTDADNIHVTGDEEAVAAASAVIEKLLELIRRGETIDRGRIRYAIDLAKDGNADLILELADDVVAFTAKGKKVKCKTLGQKKYVQALKRNTVVFGIGPAGTGKTYLAVAMAVVAFKNKEVERIILTRPAVEAGESLGFLPGKLEEKINPYLRPLYDALYDMMEMNESADLLDRGIIEVAPLAFMRGRTLNNAFVILDEAQNTTREQMLMFLTRMGFRSKCVVAGDPTQTDLPGRKASGLPEAVRRLEPIEEIRICRFTAHDAVRHSLVEKIINAYHDEPGAESREEE